MALEYKIVYTGGEAEIVEKKSRFIATVSPVKTEEEALAFIEATKKKYWNARHNCFAYIVGDQQELMRCSDDGEPNGTAGKPMLDVLTGAGLHQVVVVVTRYFGGTLLGTGGLVRAYSSSVQAGLASSQIVTRISGSKLQITTDYPGLGKIQYILGESGIRILDTQYTDQVVLEVLLSDEQLAPVQAEITEGTSIGKEESGESTSESESETPQVKTLGSLEVGSKVKVSHSKMGDIEFLIVDKDHDGYPENSTTLITEKIILFRCVDAKEPNNSDVGRKNYGNNKYSVSNLDQWL